MHDIVRVMHVCHEQEVKIQLIIAECRLLAADCILLLIVLN